MGRGKTEVKICSVCLKEKGLDSFHKNRSSKDGYHSVCKACRKEYHKNIPSKICTKCKKRKPLSGFYKHAYTKDGLQCVCKECKKKYAMIQKEKKLTKKEIWLKKCGEAGVAARKRQHEKAVARWGYDPFENRNWEI